MKHLYDRPRNWPSRLGVEVGRMRPSARVKELQYIGMGIRSIGCQKGH